MKAVQSLIAALLVAAASLAPSAQATVFDFNNLAATNPDGNGFISATFTRYNPGTTFATSGFNFLGSSQDYLIGTAYSGSDANPYAYNGTDYFMATGRFTISSATGLPFTVNSIDLASWYDTMPATQATLTGSRVGADNVTRVIDLNPTANASKRTGNDFTTYALSGFDNVSSLAISFNGSFLALDNLVINNAAAPAPVPEPSSLALLGLAIAGCAFMRRRIGKPS